jgi:hypothetical protein
MSRVESCDNMNHRRANAPVAHCPQCGRVVNASIGRRHCTEAAHAQARRERSVFCVHCGERLVAA